LVSNYINGDENSLSLLIQRHKQKIYSFIYSKVYDRDVIEYISKYEEGSKLLLLSPITLEEGRTIENKLQTLQQQGYARIKVKADVVRIDEALKQTIKSDKNLFLVVDRVVYKDDEDFLNRLADAIETAFFEGIGSCIIESLSDKKQTQHVAQYCDYLSFR